MDDLVPRLDALSSVALETVRRFETEALKHPQVPIRTEHTFHAGLYARTILIPAGVVLTGALIKIPTLLIVHGDVQVTTSEKPIRLTGYTVLEGAAGRKQAFVALTDTHLTMLFATTAPTLEAAEAEFTDETALLLSRREES